MTSLEDFAPGADFPGTLPSPLTPLESTDKADGGRGDGDVEVVVRTLKGENLHGWLRHDETLDLHGNLLPLQVGHSELLLSLRDIRSVEIQALLAMDTESPPPTARSPALVGFELHFTDGEKWIGTTLGHRIRNRGLQLYVRMPNGHFRPVWVPRSALRGARFRTTAPAEPPPAGATTAPEVKSLEAPPVWRAARTLDELCRLLHAGRHQPILSMQEALLELRLIESPQVEILNRDMPDALQGHGEMLVRAGLISPDQLAHAHARMVWVPEVDLTTFPIEPTALDRVSLKVASAHEVLPLALIDDSIILACATPLDHDLERQLHVALDAAVTLVWAARPHILQQLFQLMHPQQALPPASHPVGASPPGSRDVYSLLEAAMSEFRVQSQEQKDLAIDESSSLVKLVTRVIRDAYAERASDIHIETNPGEEFVRIRFRKDGDLEDYLRMPAFLRASLVSRIKVMSRLDISEKRRPQDGKINFQDYGALPLELRVAVLPTHDGLEDVVMRLLASSRPMPLKNLGLSEHDSALIRRLAERSFGLLLACGPTGSGKTTTLHSILEYINTDNRKIWTAEDPIEITHPGLRQLHVNPKIGVTFASAMRAFLRADPDVIMIGEVRDEETARTAIEASLTGHLVLSTLHTNNAAESVVRLLDMGMDPMNFGDSLVGIVAQRLVRALCPRCARSGRVDAASLEELMQEYAAGSELGREAGWSRLLAAAGVSAPDELRLWHPQGCEHCRNTGYKGRIGIYEILENTAEIRHLIQARASAAEIQALAQRHGMRSLRQDALEKVVQGKIDLKQARAAYL